ncbi:MAG: magnesium and cobalt transport protein CorA [Nakamurella sp.]
MQIDPHDEDYVTDVPRLPALPPIFPSGRRALGPVATPADRKSPSYLVGCAAYLDGARQPGCDDPAQALAHVRATGAGFVWVGLFEPDADDMAAVAHVFGLHELAVEDAVVAYQRPKLDRYKNYSLFVIKTVRYVDHESPTTAVEIIETGEILMILGADCIVTVRYGPHSELAGLRRSLEADPQKLAIGPAAVMHAIADRVVDHYLTVVGAVEDDIDEMETLVFNPASHVSIEQLYLLKREVLEMRRAVAPLRAPLEILAAPNDSVPMAVQAYFRDVGDHLTHVIDQVSTFDELLTALVSASLAAVTIQQNEDMRKISSWAAIALVPTAIAGIYGMNFHHMPELTWTFGYPLAILLMIAVCVLLHRALRKRGWL